MKTNKNALNEFKDTVEKGTKEPFYWAIMLINPEWKNDYYEGLDPAIIEFKEKAKQHRDYVIDEIAQRVFEDKGSPMEYDMPSLYKKAQILTEKDIALFNSGEFNVRLNLEGKCMDEHIGFEIKDRSLEFKEDKSQIDCEDHEVIYTALHKLRLESAD